MENKKLQEFISKLQTTAMEPDEETKAETAEESAVQPRSEEQTAESAAVSISGNSYV